MSTRAHSVGKGVPLVGVTPGDNFSAVRRDRHVAVRAVPCPSCLAPIGQPCVNAMGKPSHQHVARRRMALRAERRAS